MSSITRASVLGTVALAAVALVSASAVPASAAAGGVQVSPDGVAYGSSYPGALFDDIALMVPGDSQSTVFYLRNTGTEPGMLRIALQDVITSDADYADALTVTLASSAVAGTPTPVSAASPCRVLLQGQTVAPGQVVAVTSTAALGSLTGQAGQGATASLALSVGLSSLDAPTPAATACVGPTITVPATPTAPTTPTATRAPAVPGAAAGTAAGAAGTGSSLAPQAPDVELPVLNLPELFGIDPNTWHLWEELFVVLLIGSSILGGVVFALVARRRRTTADQQEELA